MNFVSKIYNIHISMFSNVRCCEKIDFKIYFNRPRDFMSANKIMKKSRKIILTFVKVIFCNLILNILNKILYSLNSEMYLDSEMNLNSGNI